MTPAHPAPRLLRLSLALAMVAGQGAAPAWAGNLNSGKPARVSPLSLHSPLVASGRLIEKALAADPSAMGMGTPAISTFLEKARLRGQSLPATQSQAPAPAQAPLGEAPAAPAETLKVAADFLSRFNEKDIQGLNPEALEEIASWFWDSLAEKRASLSPERSFDPEEGQDEVERLERVNEELAQGKLTLAEMRQRGLIALGVQPVYRNNPRGEPDKNQLMPFRQLLLPAARTGLYVPTKVGEMRSYQGLLVMIPGTGSNFSTALSLLDAAITFSKAKKDPVLDHVDGRRLRLLAFPLDATLNGLAEAAPFAFGSARGSLAVVRHALLVLRLMYPGQPAFIAGRSQGGLIAMEYARAYGDIAGAIAVNPSHTDPQSLAWTVATHERDIAAMVGGQSLRFHPKSWTAYQVLTPGFKALRELSRSALLLLLGESDPSYPNKSDPDSPKPLYLESMQGFVDAQPGLREKILFQAAPGDSHNLWNRLNESLYRQVTLAMARFCLKRLQI